MAAALSALAFAPGTVTVDERAGTYRGAGLTDTRREVERRLGRSRMNKDGPFEPLNMDFYDAMFPTSPGYPKVHKTHAIWRFKDAAIDAYDGKTFTFVITAQDAVTKQRVGVGNTLEEVQAQYAGLQCGVANEGAEWPEIPYCTGRVAPGRYVWFGGDPVRSVGMSRKPLFR